jgi:hypothetical protein
MRFHSAQLALDRADRGNGDKLWRSMWMGMRAPGSTASSGSLSDCADLFQNQAWPILNQTPVDVGLKFAVSHGSLYPYLVL